MPKTQLTQKGYDDLKIEHEDLLKNKKPKAIDRLSKARSMGDLSENAAYVSARDQQAFIEGRISELEDIIKKAVVSTGVSSGGIVSVGSKIRVHVDGGEEEYIVVGAPEADPKEGKISHESPLGNALVGKKVGDKVEIEAPMGKLVYTILSVS